MPPKLTLEWKKQARADLFGIVDFISDDNPDAAQALKDDIEAKVEKALQLKATAYLKKPFDIEELTALIDTALPA